MGKQIGSLLIGVVSGTVFLTGVGLPSFAQTSGSAAGAAPTQSAGKDNQPRSAASKLSGVADSKGNIDTPDLNLDDADISLKATVRAKELKFEQTGNVKVEFTGNPQRFVRWTTQKRNLPKKVQSGVLYKDIQVSTQIGTKINDAALDKRIDSATVRPKSSNQPAGSQ